MTVFGWGVFKGMLVTFKNVATSYFRKRDEGGIFTVQYPEEREKTIENFRNFPFLVYDETPGKIRCVACGICERECPTKCIHIEMETDATGKPARRPAVFDIDYGLCMNCGMCEEVCPFDSIFMDHAFEVTAVPMSVNFNEVEIGTALTALDQKKTKVSAERAEGLVRHKEKLLKPNEYFQRIRPTLASAIDQKRKAAEEKKRAAMPLRHNAPDGPVPGRENADGQTQPSATQEPK